MATVKKKGSGYNYPDPDSSGVDKVIANDPKRPKTIREIEAEKKAGAKKPAAKRTGKK